MLKLLDTYCKAGGAGVGYSRAGFDVVGIDIEPQKHYPFVFHQADAIEYIKAHGHEFDVIHASPVCKGYSAMAALYPGKKYPDQVAELREVLKSTGKHYIIENVVGAPLKNYVMLCGSMFGLRVYRHRLFECNPPIYFGPMACNHWAKASGAKSMAGKRKSAEILTVTGHSFILEDAREAMGIDWMNQAEISQAIPPAYTEFIGKKMIENIRFLA